MVEMKKAIELALRILNPDNAEIKRSVELSRNSKNKDRKTCNNKADGVEEGKHKGGDKPA